MPRCCVMPLCRVMRIDAYATLSRVMRVGAHAALLHDAALLRDATLVRDAAMPRWCVKRVVALEKLCTKTLYGQRKPCLLTGRPDQPLSSLMF